MTAPVPAVEALVERWCIDEGFAGSQRRKRCRAVLEKAVRLGRAEMREEIAAYVAPLDADSGVEAWALACEIRALSIEEDP